MSSTSVQLSWVVPDPTNGIILNYTVAYSNSTNTLMMVCNDDTFMDTLMRTQNTILLFIVVLMLEQVLMLLIW